MIPKLTDTGRQRILGLVRGADFQRLLLVANRLPVAITVEEDDQLTARPANGGLASGLASWRKNQSDLETRWIGWPGGFYTPDQQKTLQTELTRDLNACPVFAEESLWDLHYYRFSNQTIWPLFHYFPQYVRISDDAVEAYRKVNEAFAEAVVREYKPGDFIWIHDYQLMLLPGLLRARLPEAAIAYFHHIPFPAWDVLRLLPGEWCQEVLQGILGADLIGFHTQDYTRHFLHAVNRSLQLDHEMGVVWNQGHRSVVSTFPMGIDFESWEKAASSAVAKQTTDLIMTNLPDLELVLSVDRLDYSKGVRRRLMAFDQLLQDHPEWIGRVSLLLIVVPSRESIDDYDGLKRGIDQLVGDINGRFGTTNWTPIIYRYRSLGQEELAGTYRACKVAMVTPLRDGMNLVAKEYLACRPDGALVVSEMAGVAAELPEAWRVNPYDIRQQAGALHEALQSQPSQLQSRNSRMRQRLSRYNVTRWADDFLRSWMRARKAQRQLEDQVISVEAVQGAFAQSAQRLILTDYDGTLVGFHNDPGDSTPTDSVLVALENLARQPSTHVVVVSGRPRQTLQAWLGHLPISLAAEHGAYVMPHGGDWIPLGPSKAPWKEVLRPILEQAADRVLGAWVEEKEFSLGFHWRAADEDQGNWQSVELEETLRHLTGNDLHILRGNKVLEVRPSTVHKGAAGLWFSAHYQADFILALGDDWTDEDLFRSLPPGAWTVKVGWGPTVARFRIKNPQQVLTMLQNLGPDKAPMEAFDCASLPKNS
jgi:trehalose 6-phosphate synthase/phosphatase